MIYLQRIYYPNSIKYQRYSRAGLISFYVIIHDKSSGAQVGCEANADFLVDDPDVAAGEWNAAQ
jgi:hypothetical protein